MERNIITHESVINAVMAKHDEMNGSDFPLHLFPKRFQDIARTSSMSLGYPLDFIAGSMMFVNVNYSNIFFKHRLIAILISSASVDP